MSRIFWRNFATKPQAKPVAKPQAKAQARPSSKEFRHDYTVTPEMYSYTTDLNREAFERLPLLTAKRQARNTERPRNARLLTREFIDDSLYHPRYGYFSKEVRIFTPEKPFDYHAIKDVDDFMDKWTGEYKRYEDKERNTQLWHTPTELFRPHYGEALARYLLVNYMLSLYPYADLTIYEMGGGNGTLMVNIMDFIRKTRPEVYDRTRYKIIEISGNLATKQNESLGDRAAATGHQDKVEIINKSIFEWTAEVPEPCFFIALEVFDNFAHDVIRYDNETSRPYQGYVVVDGNGDFTEVYSPDLDPVAERFLRLRHELGGLPNPVTSPLGCHPLAQPKAYRRLKNLLWPFRESLSPPEYIPTRYLEFLDILRRYFPEHRLLTSDFTHLPDASPGYCAPVVQTVLDGKMVPVPSYMVLQGYFDILFPTDFEMASMLYRKVCNKLINRASHRDFLEQWAELDATTTRAGENPMLSFYQNAAFMYS